MFIYIYMCVCVSMNNKYKLHKICSMHCLFVLSFAYCAGTPHGNHLLTPDP